MKSFVFDLESGANVSPTSSSELDFLSALTVMPMRVVVRTLRLILRRESVLRRSRAALWSAPLSDVIFSNCLRIRITSSSTDEDMTATSQERLSVSHRMRMAKTLKPKPLAGKEIVVRLKSGSAVWQH